MHADFNLGPSLGRQSLPWAESNGRVARDLVTCLSRRLVEP